MIIKGKIDKIFAVRGDWASILVSGLPKEELKNAGFALSKNQIMFVGNIPNPVEECEMEFNGDWVNHPKYGMQFKVTASNLLLNDKSSLFKYLTSGFVEGCGKKIAEAIIEKFGDNAIDVISNDFEKLTEIPKIGKAKAKKIHDSYINTCGMMHIMNLFKGQITQKKCVKIHETYGDKAEKIIQDNPYQLICDIRGFGFKTVDELAVSSGIALNDPRRVKAAIIHTLDTISNDQGHCFIMLDELGDNIRSLIDNIDVPDKVIIKEIKSLYEEEKIILEKDGDFVRVYLKELYDAENDLARKISIMKKYRNRAYREDIVDDTIELITSRETNPDFEFEPLQVEAVKTSLRNHFSIITGGPGTGKTTIINAVAKAALAMKFGVILLAPTGRASRKLAESTGLEAYTIAKYTFSKGAIVGDEINNKPNRLFIVDETSMIDVENAAKLFYLIKKTDTVVLVGDIDQLPSIGAGNFFRDLVSSGLVPMVKLTFTHRFKGSIAENARSINRGSSKFKEDDEFEIIKEKDPIRRQELVLAKYYEELKNAGGNYKRVQIIVPMRQRGDTCTNTLNKIIRDKVNPLRLKQQVFGPGQFRVGDRVMQTSNDSELGVANGDCGIVYAIDNDNASMDVMMDVGGRKTYNKLQSTNLTIAYAITVHKSQGSEYMTVISAYGNADYVMLQRNLLYTAVTRAKNKMILIADPQALYRAVNNIEPIIRNTSINEKIAKYDGI
ncbi:SF1B family DNA helicase RecD2 [Ruminococcus albus]|uniref:SF1B family DNA helicase RecD2 n=1 Tax=Ruminococcus albus TaxID=1264 RepID=UPI00046661B6|nr:AAA family ATPase [Ruminococcus albus]